MIDITQIPFELGLVEVALTHDGHLYIRTAEEVARVATDGAVTILHTFGPQSPLAFKGLVLIGRDLLTIDRPLGAQPILTSVSLAGEVRPHPAARLHNPSGLSALNSQPLVLDQTPPLTRFVLGESGEHLTGEARNLTDWEVSGDELIYSDATGLHQARLNSVRTVTGQPGIITFDLGGHTVVQGLEQGQAVFEVQAAGGSHTVTGVQRPVALHPLASGTVVRFRNQIAPVSAPSALTTFPMATDLGTVAEVMGGLSYLDDDRQLRWSADGVSWATIRPAVRSSDIVPVNEGELVLTGRRASAWVKTVP